MALYFKIQSYLTICFVTGRVFVIRKKKIKLDKYWAMYLVVEHIVKAYDIGMTLAGTQ